MLLKILWAAGSAHDLIKFRSQFLQALCLGTFTKQAGNFIKSNFSSLSLKSTFLKAHSGASGNYPSICISPQILTDCPKEWTDEDCRSLRILI